MGHPKCRCSTANRRRVTINGQTPTPGGPPRAVRRAKSERLIKDRPRADAAVGGVVRAAPAKRGRRGRKWSGPAAEHPRTVGLRWVSAGPPMPRSGITAGPPRGGVASASAGPLHAGPPAIRCVRAVAASVSEGAPAGSELPALILLPVRITDCKVHRRRLIKAEGHRNLHDVQLRNIEDVLHGMGVVGQHVRAVRVAGGLVQIVVGLDQRLQFVRDQRRQP
mmetsp:Transcript_41342/g.69577  ORF Transcript_41342/g.69577 Transcript_41342/m.69577 type:complete len:222 (-) Transcript_41342:1477-2142(-)